MGKAKLKGRVTIPTDESFVEGTKEIKAKWGADAVRDCDGTCLPACAKDLGKVYKTYFIVRGDNDWGRLHPEEAQRIFLLSDRVLATENTVKIPFMHGFLRDQFDPDYTELKRWQVYDRTTGECLNPNAWTVNQKTHEITIPKAKRMHEYTVSFLARVTWHPVQVYNYITNNWTCEKQLTYDPAYPNTKEYIKRHMREWCEKTDTDVVRFTTFLYQFTLIFNEQGKEKNVEWFGYAQTANPVLIDEFAKETGIALTAEDFIDNGYYNNAFRSPTATFKKWQIFIARFVSKTVGELVDICHEYGKEAMMFLGDDWIGAEPYGKYFKDMHLDAVVGSVGGGVTVRMLSEIPHVRYHEGRFLPYFFPDTFFDGNEAAAVDELNRKWLTARRALMRKPLDRMGFGGYLSLAAKFPEFVNRVAEICDEFRTIIDAVGENKPYCTVKVGILNAWGSLRSWMSHMVAHELWYQQIYSYQGILEALSGLPVDVAFLSFDDVRNGVPKDIDVLINAGDAYTAFSGGKAWLDEKLQTSIREFVFNGGGFIGVGEPTAVEGNGRYFQLADVLGVDEEVGYTLSQDKYNIQAVAHEITEGIEKIDYGEDKKNIYALPNTKVLDIAFSDRFKRSVNVGEVKCAVNAFGKGRSFYITGIPYSFRNARLLYKAIVWCAGKDLHRAYADNSSVECNYYPASKKYALVNNGKDTQTTDFYDINGKKQTVTLQPMEIKWIEK